MQLPKMNRPAVQGYYAASAPFRCPDVAFYGTAKCDVCVIGGGNTGLSAALHVAKSGARTILLEAESLGYAASGRNGGQIHSGHRKSQADLERWLGVQHAHDLWSIAEEGKSLLAALVADHAIACDLKSGLIVAAHDRRALDHLTEDATHLEANYGFLLSVMSGDATARATGTDSYVGGTFDRSGGHLHPLKFAYGLASAAKAAGATHYESSPVRVVREERDGIVAETETGRVDAKFAILACDAFSGSVAPQLAKYIGHVESFIVATEPLQSSTSVLPSDAAVADTRHVLDYYRKSADGRLLFAGRESYFGVPKNIARLVRPRMLRVFPSLVGARIEYAWSGTVGITYTRMPHFGRLGGRLLFGHGYSGHGLALSVIGGKLLAQAVQGDTERFDALARLPAIPFPGGQRLRKPMISAALAWYKVVDAL